MLTGAELWVFDSQSPSLSRDQCCTSSAPCGMLLLQGSREMPSPLGTQLVIVVDLRWHSTTGSFRIEVRDFQD